VYFGVRKLAQIAQVLDYASFSPSKLIFLIFVSFCRQKVCTYIEQDHETECEKSLYLGQDHETECEKSLYLEPETEGEKSIFIR
jgi:hypothetical protein